MLCVHAFRQYIIHENAQHTNYCMRTEYVHITTTKNKHFIEMHDLINDRVILTRLTVLELVWCL